MIEKIPADREDLQKIFFVVNTMAYQEVQECESDLSRVMQRVNAIVPAFNDVYAKIRDLFDEKAKNDTEEIREAIQDAYIDMTILHLLNPLTFRWTLTVVMSQNEMEFVDLSLTLLKQVIEASEEKILSFWQKTEAEYSPELSEQLDLYLQMVFVESVSRGTLESIQTTLN